MNRATRAIGALALAASTAAPAAGVAGFGDVDDGRYFTAPVQWMVDESITTGTSASCFSPGKPVTRGEAAVFMWRMEGAPTAPPHPFTDVVLDWQQGAVSWLSAEGITTGTTAETYSPDDTLTRGQFAALLHRLDGGPTGAPDHPFGDVVRGWQQTPVSWLFSEGITTGTSETEFSPEAPVTRGQIATFLHRYRESPPVVIDDASPACGGPDPGDGFDSLFIGHSFFRPMAESIGELAPAAGFDGHTQTVVFSGGATGAPQGLWVQEAKRSTIQEVLDTGTIELFGMTYHPDHPTLEGYTNWIDYALVENPNLVVFVAMPWLTNPGDYTAASYRSTSEAVYPAIAGSIVDDLRLRYPDTSIFAIPYGMAAVELFDRWEAGALEDVSEFVGSDGSGVFRDDFGHADHILEDLASLVWLRAIYDVDLSAFDADYSWVIDLNAIADGILDGHDPAYDAPWR